MDSPRRHGDTEEHAEKSKEGFRGCGRLRVAGKPGRALLNIEWGAEEAEVAEKRGLAQGQDVGSCCLCQLLPILAVTVPKIGSDWSVNDSGYAAVRRSAFAAAWPVGGLPYEIQ